MLQSCDIICPSKQMECRHSWSAQVSLKKWPFLTVLTYRGPAPAHASLATVHQQHSFCWCLSWLDFYKKKSMVSSKKGNSYPSCLKVPLSVVTVLLSKGFFFLYICSCLQSRTTRFVRGGSTKFVPLGHWATSIYQRNVWFVQTICIKF